MITNVALFATAIGLASSPAAAKVHHKKHHVTKAAAAGAAVGGAVGLVAGAPGLVAGAAAGAAIGTAVSTGEHVPKYAGYKYWDGWYYDGKGHRFTATEMQQRLQASDAPPQHLDGYKGFYGWYYDGKRHRFSYWKGSYFDEHGRRYTASQMSKHPPGSSTVTELRRYSGFRYSNGWYYDGKGHRFTADEMKEAAR